MMYVYIYTKSLHWHFWLDASLLYTHSPAQRSKQSGETQSGLLPCRCTCILANASCFAPKFVIRARGEWESAQQKRLSAVAAAAWRGTQKHFLFRPCPPPACAPFNWFSRAWLRYEKGMQNYSLASRKRASFSHCAGTLRADSSVCSLRAALNWIFSFN